MRPSQLLARSVSSVSCHLHPRWTLQHQLADLPLADLPLAAAAAAAPVVLAVAVLAVGLGVVASVQRPYPGGFWAVAVVAAPGVALTAAAAEFAAAVADAVDADVAALAAALAAGLVGAFAAAGRDRGWLGSEVFQVDHNRVKDFG